jgi:hypothetical protein
VGRPQACLQRARCHQHRGCGLRACCTARLSSPTAPLPTRACRYAGDNTYQQLTDPSKYLVSGNNTAGWVATDCARSLDAICEVPLVTYTRCWEESPETDGAVLVNNSWIGGLRRRLQGFDAPETGTGRHLRADRQGPELSDYGRRLLQTGPLPPPGTTSNATDPTRCELAASRRWLPASGGTVVAAAVTLDPRLPTPCRRPRHHQQHPS